MVEAYSSENQSLDIQESAEILYNEISTIKSDGAADPDLLRVINSPAPIALLETLQENGVDNIDVSGMAMDTPLDRLQSVLSAGYEEIQKQGIPPPDLEPYYTAQDIASETNQSVNEVMNDLRLARGLQIEGNALQADPSDLTIAPHANVAFANAQQGFSSPGSSSENKAGEEKTADPTIEIEPINYTNIEVRLRAYELGSAPIVGKYGHAFLEYEDVTTGDIRYARAGPTAPGWPGGKWDAIRDRAFPGVHVDPLDNDGSKAIDAGIPGTFEVNSYTIRGNMDELEQKLNGFNETIDDADIPYRPRSQNSNTYAGDAYEYVTGQEPHNRNKVDLPGLDNDLMNYEDTDYSAAFD